MRRLWMAACAAALMLFIQRAAPEAGDDSLGACLAALRSQLPPQVKPATFDAQTRDVHDLRPMIDNAQRAQPEFEVPIWDYLARRTDAQRVAQGRELMKREAAALAAVERRHGVDAATTTAVFGVETDYGRVAGSVPVVEATLARACLAPKSAERKQHFFAALWLLQEGVVRPDDFKGSWAGAFGMTQFMPGTFVRFMNDGDGSPPADIVRSVPDALATTARYLRSLGWTDGFPWGVEVRVPAELVPLNALESDHGCLLDGKPSDKCRTVARWSLSGVTRVDGTPLVRSEPGPGRLDPDTMAALLMPAGQPGPAWLVTPNYHALWRYNRADAYALSIGQLSDALRGAPLQRVAWPTDDAGLSRAEFRELQGLLVARGHCAVRVDGAEGPRTSAAVREEESRLGWTQTGRGGAKLLAALRADRTAPVACPPPGPSSAASGASAPPHEPSPASAPASAGLPAPPVVPPSGRASAPS